MSWCPLCFDSIENICRFHRIICDSSHGMRQLVLSFPNQPEQRRDMRFHIWGNSTAFSYNYRFECGKCEFTYLKLPWIWVWDWPVCEPDCADAWPPPLKMDPASLRFSPSGLKPICACDDVWPGPLPWASAKPPFSLATTDVWLKCFEPPPCDEADVPPVFSSTSTWAWDLPTPPLPCAELSAPSFVPDTWINKN